ncbi:ROK family protein [Micromonospora sp. SD19]|uniref:ROK family protein n=1 Tax=Micromonospora parva TaxID=1464048 RepID=UPI00366BD29E
MQEQSGTSHGAAEPYWLAVDIGATKLAVRGERGTRCFVARQPWSGSDLQQLTRTLREARQQLGGQVGRVGVACAATLDADGRVVTWPSRPSWTGQPVRDVIADAAGAQTIIGDDGGLAALAEADAAACADLAYVGIGTGVGGGLVSGGRLITGAFGTAGEIGHLPIDRVGPTCRCGRTGCLQASTSGAALAARATRLRRRPTTEADLVTGTREGRRWAVRVCDEAASALAQAIIAVSELVQSARVHLGGGLGHALDDLPQRVTAALESRWRPGRPLPVIARAWFGADASLAGAMLVARRGRVELAAHPQRDPGPAVAYTRRVDLCEQAS